MQVQLPDSETPITIREVVNALKKQKLDAVHDKQSWGDWINFDGKQTVIAIESFNGLTSQATIEVSEGEDDILERSLKAFRALGWMGIDEDGPFML